MRTYYKKIKYQFKMKPIINVKYKSFWKCVNNGNLNLNY